ncbi:MAG: hypothetical protein KC535_06025 [Nanoarchaeota archaeon]|nr:hypothetical protein [Nanoarchaeota archaeon]
MRQNDKRRLARDISSLLFDNVDLIEKLTPRQLNRSSDAFGGEDTVGRHFRHIFNHVESFLNGLSAKYIDYEARQRNPQIETNLLKAKEYASNVQERFHLRSETSPLFYEERIRIHEKPYGNFDSTVQAQMLYLYHHTTHHDAMIRMILFDDKNFDRNLINDSFGIAPSTLRYQQNK